jgi:hypothetical protein
MRTQSVDVLNDADRTQRIMDWVLFKHEQEKILYNPTVEDPWVPGIPLIDRWRHAFYFQGSFDVCARPMFELFNHDNRAGIIWSHRGRYVCEDCEVGWDDVEGPNCFVCGELGTDTKPKKNHFTLSFNPFRSAGLEALRQAARRASEESMELSRRFGGASINFHVFDESLLFGGSELILYADPVARVVPYEPPKTTKAEFFKKKKFNLNDIVGLQNNIAEFIKPAPRFSRGYMTGIRRSGMYVNTDSIRIPQGPYNTFYVKHPAVMSSRVDLFPISTEDRLYPTSSLRGSLRRRRNI